MIISFVVSTLGESYNLVTQHSDHEPKSLAVKGDRHRG